MTPRTIAADPLAEAARRALLQFDVAVDAANDVRIEFVNRRENVVFRVTAGSEQWALKIHRPGYHTDREIESECALLESLSSSGVAVPSPVRLPDGSHIARVPDDDGTRTLQATMQRWLAAAAPLGSSPDTFTGRARPSETRLVSLGSTIARLHSCLEREGTPAGYDRVAWDAAGLCGPTALWGRASLLGGLDSATRSTFEAAEERLTRDLHRVERSAASYGPIHADLTLENVLVTADGLAMIDFDDCGEGWYLFDLATACFFLTGHEDAADMVAALLRGYRSVRPLGPSDEVAWHPLLLARALSYLAWSVERPDEEATRFHREHVLPHVVTAAQAYLTTGRTGWPGLADE